MFNNYTPTYVPNLGNGQGFGGNQSFGGFSQPAPWPPRRIRFEATRSTSWMPTTR